MAAETLVSAAFQVHALVESVIVSAVPTASSDVALR
jgi:hypothetical protein